VDVIHAEAFGDALDDGQVGRLNERHDIGPLRFDDFRNRIRPPFAAVEDVIADDPHR
jgi:hypothetical protein